MPDRVTIIIRHLSVYSFFLPRTPGAISACHARPGPACPRLGPTLLPPDKDNWNLLAHHLVTHPTQLGEVISPTLVRWQSGGNVYYSFARASSLNGVVPEAQGHVLDRARTRSLPLFLPPLTPLSERNEYDSNPVFLSPFAWLHCLLYEKCLPSASLTEHM